MKRNSALRAVGQANDRLMAVSVSWMRENEGQHPLPIRHSVTFSANLPLHETSIDDPSLAETPLTRFLLLSGSPMCSRHLQGGSDPKEQCQRRLTLSALKLAVVGAIDVRYSANASWATPAVRGALESPWKSARDQAIP